MSVTFLTVSVFHLHFYHYVPCRDRLRLITQFAPFSRFLLKAYFVPSSVPQNIKCVSWVEGLTVSVCHTESTHSRFPFTAHQPSIVEPNSNASMFLDSVWQRYNAHTVRPPIFWYGPADRGADRRMDSLKAREMKINTVMARSLALILPYAQVTNVVCYWFPSFKPGWASLYCCIVFTVGVGGLAKNDNYNYFDQ